MTENFRGYVFGDRIVIPNGIKLIEPFAFESSFDDSGKDIHSVVIPDSVIEIGDHAFCFTGLTKVTIPEGVRKIGSSAFWKCSNLTSIDIPNSVLEIGTNAFSYCSSVESIHVAEDNPKYVSVNNCLLTKDTHELVVGCKNSIIPEDVAIIQEAFQGCAQLSSIEIPNSVVSIGWHAFADCHSLVNVEIPNSVIEIHADAFCGCRSLTHIEIPRSVQSIGKRAFSRCDSLEEIRVSRDNPTYSSNQNCILADDGSKLVLGCKSSIIPNSVSVIGASAFEGCDALSHIVVPNSVVCVCEEAFSDSGLSNIDLPDSVTAIGESAFDGCQHLERVSLPKGITTIEAHCFRNCKSLKAIEFPSSLEVIKSLAFYSCDQLERVILPDGVSTIDYSAFEHCCKLSYVELSRNLKSHIVSQYEVFGMTHEATYYYMRNAFKDCPQLEVIRSHHEDPESLEFISRALDRPRLGSLVLEVPIGSGYAYRHHPYFCLFKQILAIV